MTDEADQLAPLCFVLMPFGKKMDAAGRVTNFDSVYTRIIAPAVERAGLEPIRADEEKIGGTIHKPMFERLMLCHYAVADITGANPNVFYELGIRHAPAAGNHGAQSLAGPRHAGGPGGTGGLDQADRGHAQEARQPPRRREG